MVAADRARDGYLSSEMTPHEQFRRQGHYSRDSYFAVTAVDERGRESALSNIVYVPYSHGADKLAVSPEGAVFFTLISSETQLVRWHGEDDRRDFGLRAQDQRSYRPHCAGITFDRDGNFVITDPHYQQVAVFDPRGDLVMKFGDPRLGRGGNREQPGFFHYPADVAVDAAGRFFVADRRNHRVQVFSPDGEFELAFGERGDGSGQFVEPTALTVRGGRLAVTDSGNRRVVIYDLTSDPPAPVRALPALRSPDRAVIAESGRIYVCGIDREGRGAIQVFSPSGTLERNIHQVDGVPIDRPRGLAADGKGRAYFVNALPHEVLSIPLE